MRVGIVGAGAAAAAATVALSTERPDAEVTVLEKSGGVGGRAATRRRDGVVYDYGANYVKSDDPRVVDLLTDALGTDGLVDVAEPVWTFDRDGTVAEGRDDDAHKWTCREGLTQVAKRLFARTDATIRRETRVETVRRGGSDEDDAWTLVDADGRERGPFDAVLLTPPAPQTATLLGDAEWADDRRAELADAAALVPYRTVWTGVLHYPFELDRPYYALVDVDRTHEVGWIAREECKPGHVPDGESLLVVQASHEWSVARYDEPPAENLAELAGHAAALLGDDRLRDPDWTDHQGWRYALPEAGVDDGPIDRAASAGLYVAGDWVAGEGRVHAALRNGLDVGDRIARER
ncbi:NAD(P)/FAD-dependent oxidoreductase [Salinilacihabitans rarus]|uniref:NAD(P)/FAD-dependent oxidoreductase n=1 Tax=Salinilacihabitans rarus TaxID=2961596 RepID=UPI0020C8E51E|nr:FAD-dependent oxidoreductase [Salinilacihabitans rarus]